jgi:hypothetical protein
MSTLEQLVKETRAAFIIAKSDGTLDTSEVIQIAVELAQKVQKLANLAGSEKKALLLHTLKKGLEDSGGLGSLPGFENATKEVKDAFEEQVISAASTTVDVLLSAVSGKIDLRKPASWAFCLPMCMKAVQAFAPKDMAILNSATKYAESLVPKDVEAVKVVVEEPEKPVATEKKEEVLPGTAEETK